MKPCPWCAAAIKPRANSCKECRNEVSLPAGRWVNDRDIQRFEPGAP